MKSSAILLLGLLISIGQAIPVQEEDLSYFLPSIAKIPQHFQDLDGIDSGLIPTAGLKGLDQPIVMYTTVVTVSGAAWLKLQFSEDTVLGLGRSVGPYLKLTSLLDGAVQYLDAQSLAEWYYTSAYLNGDSVRVELFASSAKIARVRLIGALVGEFQGQPSTKSICDGRDKREACYEQKTARYIGAGGCTGWIINDEWNCFLTAGHCGTNGQGSGTMQFNVPLSSRTGAITHPPPEDQFSVDRASVQGVDAGVGNDWMYLGTFRNTNTDRTAYEHVNGSTYILSSPPPTSNGVEVHIAGFGVCEAAYPQGACESQTYSQVNKNHTYIGGYTFSGTTIRYRTDTTGGNSGSGVEAVTRDVLGNPISWAAIGIHTHGGCSNTGGSNAGTSLTNNGLSNALRSPAGVCVRGPQRHVL